MEDDAWCRRCPVVLHFIFISAYDHKYILYTELVFLNVKGAQEYQGIDPASLLSLAGRYDNPIPTWFLASIDCLKTPIYVPC